MPSHPRSRKRILILSSHLRLGHPNVLCTVFSKTLNVAQTDDVSLHGTDILLVYMAQTDDVSVHGTDRLCLCIWHRQMTLAYMAQTDYVSLHGTDR